MCMKAHELIESHDWEQTLLGGRQEWPQSLCTAVQLVLGTSFPMFLIWGQERTLIYNDAYVQILGGLHPNAFGRSFFDVWPDVQQTVEPIIDEALTGNGSFFENLPVELRRSGRLETAWFTFSYSPIFDEAGAIPGVLCVCVETTASILESERQIFLADLRDRLRQLADAAKIIHEAQRALGSHLRASRVGYGSFDEAERYFTTSNNWTDGTVPHHNGTHDIAVFGEAVYGAIRRGETLVVKDLEPDEVTPPEVQSAFKALEIEAGVTVSLVKAGRLVAALYVHQKEPRYWNEAEVATIEEVAEITWSALEQWLAESALRESQQQLFELNQKLQHEVDERTAERDRMWDLSRDLLVVIDRRWRMVAVNPAVASVGYDVAEVTGTRFDYYLHSEDLKLVQTSIRKAAKGPVGDFEARLRAKDGSWRWFSWSAAPGLGRAYVSGRDVTDEKARQARLEAAEAARRQADALYRAYFESTPEALFVIRVEADGGFLIEEINAAHEAGVGLRADDVRGKRLEEILPADIAEQVLRTYRHVVETRTVFQYREVFNLNGDPQHWDTSLLPVLDAQGRVARLIGSSRNVTPQIRAEEALRQSQKMEAMGQLTGGVAHDFNNLLTPIVGALDLLQRKGVGGEREQRLLAGAAQSAERAKTLVQRLLAFARRQPLQSIPVDVADLVRGMGDLVASTTGPQIRVALEVAEDLPPATADPNQLEMALLNLSVNARDAMPEGGTLRVSVSREAVGAGNGLGLKPGTFVKLSVADTGIGMDEGTLARAIEPFFSTKGVGRGTGLGLSMVHGLALQLGGAFRISSQQRLGTNAELWLPASADQPQVQRRAKPQSHAAGEATILLVDDEELVRESTAAMLADLGYQVFEASSADEALRFVDDGLRFDVLITDHLMPGMNGTDLAREVRTMRPETKALIVSGYAEDEGIAPDLPRLTKPFRSDELIASLSALARR